MEWRLLAPAAGGAASAVAAAATVEDAGAAKATFTLIMPLMVEGASAPLELTRGVSKPQPKVSPRSSPGGSYPTPLALSSSLPILPFAHEKEAACCLLAPTRMLLLPLPVS